MDKRTATRAAIYVRVSTDGQVGGTSPADQLERCREYVSRQGWVQAGEFVDNGESGAKSSRPELDCLMGACRAGHVDAVVVAKLDRFGRSTRHLAAALGELDDLGVTFVSLAEAFDSTSPSGRLQRSILGSFAEFEREQIRERTLSGQRRTASEGFWPSGMPPYGYRIVPDGRRKRLELDEHEAEALRLAARLVVEGLSLGTVATRLNALGYKRRWSPRWEHHTLRRKLMSPVMIGRYTWARASKMGIEPVELRLPPILTENEYSAVTAALAASANGPRVAAQHFYPLSGRIVGTCGEAYTGNFKKDRGRCYRCRNTLTTAPNRCHDNRLPADDIDFVVWEAVSALLQDPERLLAMAADFLSSRAPQMTVERDQLIDLDRRIDRLRTAATSKVTEYLKAGVDAATVKAAGAEVEAQITELERHRQALVAWREHTAQQSGRMRTLWDLAELAHARLGSMTPHEQAIVHSLLDTRVTVLEHKTKVSPTLLKVEGSINGELLVETIRSLGDTGGSASPAVLGPSPSGGDGGRHLGSAASAGLQPAGHAQVRRQRPGSRWDWCEQCLRPARLSAAEESSITRISTVMGRPTAAHPGEGRSGIVGQCDPSYWAALARRRNRSKCSRTPTICGPQ